MPSASAAPDAWEDDWEKLADEPAPPPAQEKKVSSRATKAQRRAAQAEFNRQLWAEAESAQEPFHFLESRSHVPFKQEFKPAVTVLSRKPQLASRPSSSSASVAVESAAAGVQKLGLNGPADDESDDGGAIRAQPKMTAEERHAKALRDLEEKQRKYEEVRERLFGSPSGNDSGASSPGTTTPPTQGGIAVESKAKGRGRGGSNNGDNKRDLSAASSGKSRRLYDPGYSAKPRSSPSQSKDRQQQTGEKNWAGKSPELPRQPVRNPRGPDGSGRGGFGFFNRGGRGD